MIIQRHRCDGCNREVDPPIPGMNWAADGWLIVEGPWGGGEAGGDFHLCSYDCLINWANRRRVDAARQVIRP